jgi:hypothetical protein
MDLKSDLKNKNLIKSKSKNNNGKIDKTYTLKVFCETQTSKVSGGVDGRGY